MAMSMGSGDGGDDQVISAINTTPLVDVMLVLLIIFLIAIPVAIQSVPVQLPHASNIPNETKPENITIAVDPQGNYYWNASRLPNAEVMFEKMKVEAVKVPQPEFHIRGDKSSRFEYIGRLIVTTQRAGIQKIAFVTEPDR